MKLPFVKKRPKHEPTESFFHLSRQISKCIMISNNLNWYDHGGYTKITAPYSNANVTNEGESKLSIKNENLSQSCSTNENKSKHSIVSETLSPNCSTYENKSKLSIVNEPLSQKFSADKNKFCSTKKDAKNEVACDVTNCFNISNVFECGRNNPDVTCERAFMANEDNEYFTDILETLNK